MSSHFAVIGGTGLYKLEGIKILKEEKISTPFGETTEIFLANLEGVDFYFLPRHGKNHHLLPSEVNYCANIFALKSLDVSYVISCTAVGSLKKELPPTHFVLPDQYIDWTKGLRRRSFFGEGLVGHVSVANPIEKSLQEAIEKACKKAGASFTKNGTYVCIEGPQFSSRAESRIFQSLGASIIGMTNVPEAYLAKEAGLSYATIAMITDYDCIDDIHCSQEEISKVMKKNMLTIQDVLKILLPELKKNPPSFKSENKEGIISSSKDLSEEKQKILEILLK